jgi:hypothetical protein
MNALHEDDFARRITGYLDAGSSDLREGTAYRLQLARQAALAHLGETQVASGYAHAGNGLLRLGGGHFRVRHLSWWLSLGALLVALASYYQYTEYQNLRDIEETDAALLASELPVEAYLDRGFHNWLKHGE